MINIRKFEKTDANQCAKIIRRALKQLNSADYPKEVINYMVQRTTPEELLLLNLKREFIVAERDGEIVGTATLERNNVGGVYVDPNYINRGIGKRLMKEIENIALSRGIEKLEFGATITSAGFYMKLGYDLGEKIDTGPMGSVIKATKKLPPLEREIHSE